MSKISAYWTSVSRDAIRRVGPRYKVTVQIIRQRARRNLDVTAVVAVAAIGLIVGLLAGFTPTSQGNAAQIPQASSRPYTLYDSTTPSSIPAGHPIASYATGSYAVSPSQVTGHSVIWIDTNGSDPKTASVLDVEPGNVSPAFAATWTKARLAANPDAVARIYTMLSEWPAAKASIATLPGWMQSHVRWWIADPTGVPHVVPGSSATQWYWGTNYDISTVNPGF